MKNIPKYKQKNPVMNNLILDLKKLSSESGIKLWKQVAMVLQKPLRSRSAVNVAKIEQYADDSGRVLVIGKILGFGTITKKVTVVALNFSDTAKQKIVAAGGKCFTIADYIKKNSKDVSAIKILK